MHQQPRSQPTVAPMWAHRVDASPAPDPAVGYCEVTL